MFCHGICYGSGRACWFFDPGMAACVWFGLLELQSGYRLPVELMVATPQQKLNARRSTPGEVLRGNIVHRKTTDATQNDIDGHSLKPTRDNYFS